MGKKSKNQGRRNKINLVFDETKRKDFLCGFRKRKLERKKKAQEELQRLLKEEKKRIKQENRESYKKLIVSSRPIPDIEQLLQDEYEDEDVNVKIVELSADTLQKKDVIIGENRPKKLEKNNEIKESVKIEPKIQGMGSDTEIEEDSDGNNDQNDDNNLKSKKELKRILKQQATKKIQKSKIFQMKSKLDKVQNIKINKKKSAQKKGQLKSKGSNSRKGKPKKKDGRGKK